MTKDKLLQSLCKACDRPLNWDTAQALWDWYSTGTYK